MRFGIVGTNWITDRLIEAGQTTAEFEVTAVYSRTKEKADDFADKHHIEYRFDNWEAFLASDTYEAVYIATPNLLHARQSIDAMKHGKHVLCEKPLTLTVAQAKEMFQTARDNNVILMEAMKSTESAAFRKLEEWIHEIGLIRRVNFHYNQYSSRYDKLKEGIIENAFKPELGNGSLMDLGVYTIAPLVKLFGVPDTLHAAAEKLSTGADGQGTVLCQYSDMTAVLSFSKIADSYMPSEIIGEAGIITIDKISAPSHIVKMTRAGETLEEFTHSAPPMSYEVANFTEACKTMKLTNNNEQTSLDTLRVVEAVKEQIGLAF
ncbi:Gfo/Idh/MocA family protein [Macrococcus equipercicus]|uniref:Gfo/Idh/MocA family oxidoreductase n=1 Tax=Macrococcus equipercicus TaxID=69967 RepID=A0A9Q9F327_9STAP|nr:Gfo/Idh/MocA family oxidoreductase [Macrococcus equipercicus]KAA1037725.1 Gfo/Idh/MocA family oxidoreductase [Macrococcus equipercicus]UTH13439.1 Gfo/Idh/MocA family oxidoreductase [Macrococcus equipercicus]